MAEKSLSDTLDSNILCQLRDDAINLLVVDALPLIRKKAKTIEHKANEVAHDLVTDVDYNVEKLVLRQLKKLCESKLSSSFNEKTQYLGEEGFKKIDELSNQLIWLLDPIDGTLNYANDLPNYSISLGLIADGRPVLGIVVDAVSGEVFDAIDNNGARLNGNPLKMKSNENHNAPMTMSTGTIRLLLDKGRFDTLSALFEMNGRLRLAGSQALQLCWAAAGRLGININREARIWDDIAGALIAREAGAIYLRMDKGNIFQINASDPGLCGDMLFSICGSPEQVKIAKELLETAGKFG